MAKHHRRRRRRLNPGFLVFVAICIGLLSLIIFGVVSCSRSMGETPESTQSTEDTGPKTGWMEEDGKRYYLQADGSRATGWLTLDGKQYFLTPEGYTQSGWIDGRYFREDGSMATGTVVIDGVNHHFSSQGAPILVANPWNAIPEDYVPDLVPLSLEVSVEGSQVDRSCYDALMEMINACNAQEPRVCVASSYRTMEYQTNSYQRKVQSYLSQGYSQEEAEKEAATIIARPGTSEHQLGLAVDIIDTRLWKLEEEQANLPAQQWLMAHCWEYGFILRYPKDKMDSTGIIYEPWHYRYVGKELAKELHELGLTLEEYLESLTD